MKIRTNESKLIYIRQINYCVSLIRKGKNVFYANLNVKDITDNRKFWNTVKRLSSDKPKSKNTIILRSHQFNSLTGPTDTSFSKIKEEYHKKKQIYFCKTLNNNQYCSNDKKEALWSVYRSYKDWKSKEVVTRIVSFLIRHVFLPKSYVFDNDFKLLFYKSSLRNLYLNTNDLHFTCIKLEKWCKKQRSMHSWKKEELIFVYQITVESHDKRNILA